MTESEKQAYKKGLLEKHFNLEQKIEELETRLYKMTADRDFWHNTASQFAHSTMVNQRKQLVDEIKRFIDTLMYLDKDKEMSVKVYAFNRLLDTLLEDKE